MSDSEIQLSLGGYQCKLFDDPEKFLESYEGRHLHPWNGDNSLMIDRFDCRNFLTTLEKYDSSNPSPSTPVPEKSDEDVMCEYERYLELLVDVQEENTIAEEGEKRYNENLNGYAAVKFSYDTPTEAITNGDNPENNVPNDKIVQEKTGDEADLIPYILPHDLAMPSDYILPKTEKQATVIEKTAAFIARQGVQMEIVLKTRQADNSQFAFLEHGNELNPFYKEMTRLIRIGMYIPRRFIPYNNNKKKDDLPGSEQMDVSSKSAVSFPKVDISGTSYAALINRFKSKANKPAEEKNGTESPKSDSTQAASEAEDKRWQEKYNQLYQHYYTYYHQHYLSAYGGNTESTELAEKATQDAMTAAQAAAMAIRKSETEPLENLKEDMSSDQCVIIDKMAEYVAKNGTEFETVVYSQKGSNPQFAFLQPIHKFHAYYLARRKSFQITMAPKKIEKPAKLNAMEDSPPETSRNSIIPQKKVDLFKIKINAPEKNYPEEKTKSESPKKGLLVGYDSDSEVSDVELHPSLLGGDKTDESAKSNEGGKEKSGSPSSTLKMALMQVNQMSILHNASKEKFLLMNKVKPPLTALMPNPKIPLIKSSSKLKKSRDKSPKESSSRHHKKSRSNHRSRSPKRRRTPTPTKSSKSPAPTPSKHHKSHRSRIYESKLPTPPPVTTSPNDDDDSSSLRKNKVLDKDSLQLQLERKQKAAAFFARLKKESDSIKENGTAETNGNCVPENVPAAVVALMKKNGNSEKVTPMSYSAGANILEDSVPLEPSVPEALLKAFPDKRKKSYIRNGAPPEAYSDRTQKSSSRSAHKKSSKSRHRSRSGTERSRSHKSKRP